MKHLESLFERALDAVVGMDDQGMVIAWNAAAEEIFGWSRDEALGRSMGDLIVPLQHRENHAKGLEHYKKTGEGPVLEKRVTITALHRDGQELPIELSIFPMLDAEGSVSFYAFIRSLQLEQAVQREQEARAEEGKALLAVAEKLLDDTSLEDFTQFCLATVCRVTGMEAGHLQTVRGKGDGARLYPTNVWHLSDEKYAPVIDFTHRLKFRRGEGVPGRAWETGELQIVEDVAAAPVFVRRKIFTSVGLSCAVALPLWQGSQVYGVLEFFGTAKSHLEPQVLRMIQTIGSQIGVAIRRKEHSEYRETLRREMSHRVGNSLAVLSSIYRSCSRTAKTKDELDALYLSRITAVARASRLALDHASHDAPLRDLVDAAIDIFPDRAGITVDVPQMMVQSDSVMPLALVLNELATNTLKHRQGGKLNIHAQIDPAKDEVVLEWEETAGECPQQGATLPERSGFGTTLMQVMIEEQLAGRFEREITAVGFRMVAHIPRVRLAGDAECTPRGAGEELAGTP
ncbi:MAG TPA: hypothetical protein DIT67_00880 [Octadecabacter sp.]|nr:hypothetical protein [Octadecabacter sp.]